jgi:hypothetical protein
MEHLFGNSSDYSLLRIFGCACWPNLQPYNKHKLCFRSKQCAFIGYSSLHKGYRCLDISTGHIYISHEIVFDETVFPFASLHSNAGARLRQEIDLLPLSLQLLNLHHIEGHELQGPVDVDPANAADSDAESFLKDTDQHFMSDDDYSGPISSSGAKIYADTPRDCSSAAAHVHASSKIASARACSSRQQLALPHGGSGVARSWQGTPSCGPG